MAAEEVKSEACECDGSGFIYFVADFQISSRKRIYGNVEQVRRCPGYFEYFRATPLMKDYPEKTPPRDYHGACPAAMAAHRDLFNRSETKRKSEDGPKI